MTFHVVLYSWNICIVYIICLQQISLVEACYIFDLACNVLSSTLAPKALHAHH